MAGMGKRLTDLELKSLHKNLCEGIAVFHDHLKRDGRARVLFYAMAAYLDKRGILNELRDAADYVAENRELWDIDAGTIIH